MARGTSINAEGLSELSRALRRISPELVGELKAANFALASKAAAEGRQRASGDAQAVKVGLPASIAATNTAGYAGIRFGGNAGQFGAEFGAGHDRPRDWAGGRRAGYNQFRSWRGNGVGAGYFVYPAIHDVVDAQAIDEYSDAIEKVARKLGFENG